MSEELQAALVDLAHKNAFDLLLKETWNPEQAAMGNSTLSTGTAQVILYITIRIIHNNSGLHQIAVDPQNGMVLLCFRREFILCTSRPFETL